MRFLKKSIVFAMALSFSAPIWADDMASWLRTRISNVLNPKISLIGDFVYKAGPARNNKFDLREVELTYQAEIDPNTRADFFLALPSEEEGKIEVEEGYITLLSLPLDFQLRGGKFFPNFGRLNMVHGHELPQVDRPLALETYFGEEGLRDTGVEVSRVFTPLDTFVEFSYAFLNGLGEAEEEEAATTTITDTDGNTVTVAVASAEEESNKRNPRDFGQVARLRVYKDITEASNVDLGFSGAIHQPKGGDQRTFGGVDLTFRWKPLREGAYKSFIWRTEYLYSSQDMVATNDAVTGAVADPMAKFVAHSGYSYVEVQPLRRWRFGVRGDYVENPRNRMNVPMVTRAVSPYITFTSTEFSRYRVQYQYKDVPNTTQDEHIGWLQWTIIMGPHGAHPF